MKQPIRYFSIGLLTASVILLLAFYFVDHSSTKTEDLSIDEIKEAIKTDGYRVVTEAEYISLSVNDKKDSEKDSQEKEKNEKKDDSDKIQDNEPEKETYTINIKSGMLPSEISEVLAENGIIKDADKFDQYLEEEEYSKYIQLGKHKFTSDMSNEDAARALTK